jgi:antitoxin (DNA-binding transcriptional repressor) of toxin-antitoxin stability system
MMSTMVDTKFVGVRELKQGAPRWIRRAADGTRIVITRYGKPAAVLSQFSAPTPTEGSERMRHWEKERTAFSHLSPAVVKRWRGRYVAVADGKVVGSDINHERLYERVFRKLGNRPFFIGLVGEAPPAVELPGFEIE